MATIERTLNVCDPCRSEGDHHMECAGTLARPCSCLICDAKKIGDAVMGDQIPDRLRPRPWRPGD